MKQFITHLSVFMAACLSILSCSKNSNDFSKQMSGKWDGYKTFFYLDKEKTGSYEGEDDVDTDVYMLEFLSKNLCLCNENSEPQTYDLKDNVLSVNYEQYEILSITKDEMVIRDLDLPRIFHDVEMLDDNQIYQYKGFNIYLGSTDPIDPIAYKNGDNFYHCFSRGFNEDTFIFDRKVHYFRRIK